MGPLPVTTRPTRTRLRARTPRTRVSAHPASRGVPAPVKHATHQSAPITGALFLIPHPCACAYPPLARHSTPRPRRGRTNVAGGAVKSAAGGRASRRNPANHPAAPERGGRGIVSKPHNIESRVPSASRGVPAPVTQATHQKRAHHPGRAFSCSPPPEGRTSVAGGAVKSAAGGRASRRNPADQPHRP